MVVLVVFIIICSDTGNGSLQYYKLMTTKVMSWKIYKLMTTKVMSMIIYKLMTMAKKAINVICQQLELILATELHPSWLQWLLSN